jgi:hypothetical protein
MSQTFFSTLPFLDSEHHERTEISDYELAMLLDHNSLDDRTTLLTDDEGNTLELVGPLQMIIDDDYARGRDILSVIDTHGITREALIAYLHGQEPTHPMLQSAVVDHNPWLQWYTREGEEIGDFEDTLYNDADKARPAA